MSSYRLMIITFSKDDCLEANIYRRIDGCLLAMVWRSVSLVGLLTRAYCRVLHSGGRVGAPITQTLVQSGWVNHPDMPK
eukprot:scaffold25925_cov59-Attheya_sp.AAC.2